MRIGVIYNCQGEGVAAGLRALLPNEEVVDFIANRLPAGEAARQELASVLLTCDAVISSGFAQDWGPLADKSLRPRLKQYHVLPVVAFTGFHPDQIYVRDDAGNPVQGPTGDYHSRIAVAGYLGGLDVAETVELYNKLAFRRLGYFDTFSQQSALLTEFFGKLNIDAIPLLRRWLTGGCFMHAINHPKNNVLLDIARAACARLRLVPARDEVDEALLGDALAKGPTHPVFLDIATAAHVAAEGAFRTAVGEDGRSRTFALEEFLVACFARYSKLDASVLLRGEGVADALQKLGLPTVA